MIAGPLAPDGVRARSMPPTAERLAVTCERGGVDQRTYEPISGPGRSRHAASLDRRASPSALRGVRVLTRRDSRPLREVPVSLPFLTASVPPDAVGSRANYPETLEATPRAAEARLGQQL